MSSHGEKEPSSEASRLPEALSQARGQMLWTAVVVIALAWVALDQAAGPLTANLTPTGPANSAAVFDEESPLRASAQPDELLRIEGRRLPASSMR